MGAGPAWVRVRGRALRRSGQTWPVAQFRGRDARARCLQYRTCVMTNLPEAVPGEPTPSGQARRASAARGRTAAPALPAVAVGMPVLNEERHLAQALAHLPGPDHPAPVAVGLALRPS